MLSTSVRRKAAQHKYTAPAIWIEVATIRFVLYMEETKVGHKAVLLLLIMFRDHGIMRVASAR